MNGLSDVEILTGLGYAGSEERQSTLAAAVVQMSPKRKAAAMAKIVGNAAGSNNKSVRDLVLDRLDSLPPEIVAGLAQKRLQIVGMELISTKAIEGLKQVNFFEDADTIASGTTNVNNGKLRKDEWFLCTGIQYLEGAGLTADGNFTDAFFTTPGAKTANGDFDFKANGGKLILGERSPLSMFTDVSPLGGYQGKICAIQLENPKWIEPQVKIDFLARYAVADTTDHLNARVKLIGASIIPL